jgi:hypothetical protein
MFPPKPAYDFMNKLDYFKDEIYILTVLFVLGMVLIIIGVIDNVKTSYESMISFQREIIW